METIEELIKLYQKATKHSNYQIMPSLLRGIINSEHIHVSSRYEFERMDFISKNLNLLNKRILDIGGNTGFFSFESIHLGAKEVICFEGNKNHAEFIRRAAAFLNTDIQVNNIYLVDGNQLVERSFDVIFLLNVVHHFGDDFGEKDLSLDEAKNQMIDFINSFARTGEFMVFQMGFNWQGKKESPLFNLGTKEEMISFLKNGLENFWSFINIGVAEVDLSMTKYLPLSNKNLGRNDQLGEFLNRPIFILKSKKWKVL